MPVDRMEGLKYLTRSEAAKLFARLRKDDYELYCLLYLSYIHGLRASEVLDLKFSDYDIHEGRVFIRRKKGSVSNSVKISDQEMLIFRTLRSRRTGSKLFNLHRSTVDRKIKRAFRKYRLPSGKAHHHTFRHTLAVHLLQQKVDIYTIKEILGHRDIRNTMIYAKLTGYHLDEIQNRIGGYIDYE